MKIPDTLPWQLAGNSLGSGGQANVVPVTSRKKNDGELFALKALRNVGSPKARERFLREIEAVKRLDSNWIAKILDCSEPDNPFQYYVMTYYEGATSLSKIIYSKTNPYYSNPLKCLHLLEQLTYAIRACEEAKPLIVHRDIKPDNILVLPDGTIRLIDFGVCQIQDGEIVTFVDENVGARNYAAPECEAGNDNQIGVHSDLYSASKVLWSAITSQRAFAREKPVFGNRSLSILLPDNSMSWHLNDIFENTIRANPSDRFKNTEELLQSIHSIKYLIECKYPPLLEIAKRCPSCGNATVSHYERGIQIFTNPRPDGTDYCICDTCGFVFIRETKYLLVE